MNIREFLQLVAVDWAAFSKNKSVHVRRWTAWDNSFQIVGRGQAALVQFANENVFRFAGHCRREWGIDSNINYAILYEIYTEAYRKQGRAMTSLKRIAAQFDVHPNTISSYVNTLVDAGLMDKQVWSTGLDQKRIALRPKFHKIYEYK